LRNIESHPAVLVESGGERYVPSQRLLQPEEAAAVFTDWTRRQRWFARLMLAQIGFTPGAASPDEGAVLVSFPFVAFKPRDERTNSSRH
jgi:hypothetical protein